MDADQGVLKPHRESRLGRGALGALAVFLIGIGGSWSAGNLGPVVNELRVEFGISLATVGLLAGTIFYAAMVAGLLIAPRAAERLGLTRALALGAALGAAGNVIFAVADGFALAAVGRIITGIGLGFAGGLGPVLARATGGVGRVGLFGASFQLGIALGLGVGSALADGGVEWRVGFLVTAAVAASAIPLVLREHLPVQLREPIPGFVPAAIRSGRAWRLALLFMAMFAVPLTLGAWFVHYVTVDGTLEPGLAGALAFVLFGVSALMRELGGKLASKIGPATLTGAAPLLATAGLVAIGLDVDAGVVAVAVLLMAAGFALPYASMMIAGQRLWPEEPARPTSMFTLIGTAVAIPVIPVLGSLLDSGDGDLAFITLGLFVLVAAALNVRSTGGALDPIPPRPDARGDGPADGVSRAAP